MKMLVVAGTCTDSIKGSGDVCGLATYSMGSIIHRVFACLAQDWAECLAVGCRCGSYGTAEEMAPSRPSQAHCLIARLYMENKQPLWKEKRLQTVVLKTENHGGVHWTCCHADCFTALEDQDMQELGSASQQGLGRWWHPVISCFISGEEDWWIDMFF